MAQLLGEQYFVARDRNGLPISGATVFFFLTGTSTPAAVYADAELEVELGTEDLTSDSAGRFPPIYLDPDVIYRMRVYDGDPAAMTNPGVEIEPSPFDPLTNFSSLVSDAVAAVVASGVGNAFDQEVYFLDEPAAGEVILAVRFARAVNFSNNFAGQKFETVTRPSESVAYTIKKNGSSIGTMTIPTVGEFVFATSETPQFIAGGKLTITGPADSKGAAGIYGTLPGVVA